MLLSFPDNGKLKQPSCFSLRHLHIAMETIGFSAAGVAMGGIAYLHINAWVIPARQNNGFLHWSDLKPSPWVSTAAFFDWIQGERNNQCERSFEPTSQQWQPGLPHLRPEQPPTGRGYLLPSWWSLDMVHIADVFTTPCMAVLRWDQISRLHQGSVVAAILFETVNLVYALHKLISRQERLCVQVVKKTLIYCLCCITETCLFLLIFKWLRNLERRKTIS